MPKGQHSKLGPLARKQNNNSKETLNDILIWGQLRLTEKQKRARVIAGIKKYRAEQKAKEQAE